MEIFTFRHNCFIDIILCETHCYSEDQEGGCKALHYDVETAKWKNAYALKTPVSNLYSHLIPQSLHRWSINYITSISDMYIFGKKFIQSMSLPYQVSVVTGWLYKTTVECLFRNNYIPNMKAKLCVRCGQRHTNWSLMSWVIVIPRAPVLLCLSAF